MAQSHIKITGGLLDGKSMRNTISIIGHTFEAGQALRFNRGAGTGVCGDFYAPAIADSAANSEVIGVVESVEGSSFVLVYGGEISTSNFDGKFALVDDDVFFLSGTTPGLVENIPPSTAGQVIKPVLVRSDGNRAIVTNFIGTVIGGSSVVNLDGIQPVGTIEPYAGQANDVPATWSLCDGGALSTTEFIDLYNRIGREFGYHVTIESTAIGTNITDIAVGQVIQQSGGVTGRIVSIDSALNQITVDVDYLRYNENDDPDGFKPHNITSFVGSSLTFTIPTAPSSTDGIIYAGSITPKESVQPSSDITLSGSTGTITAFRKPDLRGKVVMGTALKDNAGTNQEGTVIVADRDSPRGSILGEYEHQLTEAELAAHSHGGTGSVSTRTGTVGGTSPFSQNNNGGRDRAVESQTVTIITDIKGEGAGHNNLQPTVAINWIIKTTANAAAAVIDNLTTQIPLTDLTDVDITPSDGDIVMYDASNTPVKFKAYNLLTNYKPNAEQIFQIDTSGTNPKVRFGGPTPASANGFSVNLDGLGSGASKFEILNGTDDPLMSLQKTTATDQTYGIASIGTDGPPDEDANLMLGNKGLLFQSSSSTPVNKIVTTVAPLGTATDTNLVTEKAVRTAISDGSQTTISSYVLCLGENVDRGLDSDDSITEEVFPEWHSGDRLTGTGVQVKVEPELVNRSGNNVHRKIKLSITNSTELPIIVSATFGDTMFAPAQSADIGAITVNLPEMSRAVSGSINERLVGANSTETQGSSEVQVLAGNNQDFVDFFMNAPQVNVTFRKATAEEISQEVGRASASFTP